MKRLNKLVENRKVVYVLTAIAAGILCAVIICYLVIGNLGIFAGFFGTVAKVLAPIIIGLVLAYIIDPVAKFFENKVFAKMKREKLRRTISAIIALVLVFAMLALFIGTLIPSLIGSISMLVANVDTYYESIESVVSQINKIGFGIHIDLSAIKDYVNNWLGNLVSELSKDFSSVLSTTKDIGSSVITIVIGVILAVYILFSKEYMLKGLRRLRKAIYTPKTYERHTKFWKRCDDIFTQYIGCNVIDALIIGISNAIFMLILGMPYVSLVSFVVGIANLIPTFGPIIGGAIGALVLVLVKPSFALWFLIFTIGIQILDAYVIKPRLFSSSFGMAAVWTLISITVGGNLFGIIGVLLAIPVAAILSFIYDERFIPWLEKKSRERAKRANEKEEYPDEESDEESVGEKIAETDS